MTKKEDLIVRRNSARYILSEKVMHVTAKELRRIANWEEYETALLATEELEEYEKNLE